MKNINLVKYTLLCLYFILFFDACTLRCRILNWSLVNCWTSLWICHSYIRIDCRIIYARGGCCVLSREMLFYWGHFYLKKLYLELEDWFSLPGNVHILVHIIKENPTDCQNLYSFNILIVWFHQWSGLSSKSNT